MRFQPKNPNTALPNRHTLYLACSGGGKSQALSQNPDIPKNARVILWDASGDHSGDHYETKPAFLKALKAAIIKDAKDGKGFRIAYAGAQSVADFEWFIEVCWSVLDGRFVTYVIVEELSAVCPNSGKATPVAAVFMNQARKYGGVFHGASQKPQEIAKTFFDQCPIKYIGQQSGEAMQKKMAAEVSVTPAMIKALEPLQFYRHDGTAKEPELIKLKYKKVTGVNWK